MNAPVAGTITKFLVNEEDTVTVGQDLLKLELGVEKKSEGQQKVTKEPNALGSNDESATSQPELESEKRSTSQDSSFSSPRSSSSSEKESKTTAQEQTPSNAKNEPQTREKPESKTPEPMKSSSKPTSNISPYGNRQEQRVNPH